MKLIWTLLFICMQAMGFVYFAVVSLVVWAIGLVAMPFVFIYALLSNEKNYRRYQDLK